MSEGIRASQMSGCVVLVGRRGKIVYREVFGHRQLEPEPVAMTPDALFDLASLTKPIATATSVMILWERGELMLSAPVAQYIPEFAAGGKEAITVFDLLPHQAGLIPDNSLGDYRDGEELAWQRLLTTTSRKPAGEAFLYSDAGFLVLQELVRRVSGQELDEFAEQHIFGPLGMDDTCFNPDAPRRSRAVATERRDGRWLIGEVHDPRAHLLGGVAGHAGLFSTADDLARYAQLMLDGGSQRGVRVLKRSTVQRMTRGYQVPGGFRGLGWDSFSGYSSNRGDSFSTSAFGHGGFTGTSLWMDPDRELFVIFLSSRLHPDGKGSINQIAGRIGTIAADAVLDHDPPQVLPGIDVLYRDSFRQLAGRNVGLITNHTGVCKDGTSTVKRLSEAENLNLVALFSPEHGLYGRLDIREISDSRDEESQLPVYSLYGKTRRPTPEMLEGVDTRVFDIQDIGTRFYTYISTMGRAMEAASERGIRFVVLDRPNPIGGVEVDGPMLDAGRESFVGYHTIPVRHGMTVEELALLFRHEFNMDLDLRIIEVEGWRRGQFQDETDLRWINPSPNMRSLSEALLYPGVGLLETTNLSVGRGTDGPFEIVGAPWVDGEQLCRSLNACRLRGVSFNATSFTPLTSKFHGEACRGVTIEIADREHSNPMRTGFEIARQLRVLYPDEWDASAYDRLLGNEAVFDAILAAEPIGQIERLYRNDLDAFLARRSPFLLYGE